jgi:hypothetical protein
MELIRYDEAYKILNDKFKLDHNELHYIFRDQLIQRNGISPKCVFSSDIPHRSYENELLHWQPPWDECRDPEVFFYSKEWIEKFVPVSHFRFVYGRQLKDRFKAREQADIWSLLKKAGERYILSWYQRERNEFGFTRKFKAGDKTSEINWALTEEGKEYIENPDSFYLFCDIIDVERIFLNRSREYCLEELGIEIDEFGMHVRGTTQKGSAKTK